MNDTERQLLIAAINALLAKDQEVEQAQAQARQPPRPEAPPAGEDPE